ncbi:MAG TPA: hypothetical protein VHB46_17095 [Burkholderiales bacterium]|nr:hypothetical protein [Burkholderiales bacterium]
MAPDEIMVYGSMAIVPVVAGLVGLAAFFRVRRNAISILTAYALFVAAVLVGMLLSFAVVNAFSYLLHGDGALAIIAAPITGAILATPVAVVFAVALAITRPRRD